MHEEIYNKEAKSLHYLMSDIHGDCWRFNQMLRKIQFSGSDILYVIGDILDGGNENLRLLNQIRRDPRMRMIKGNHELFAQMYLEERLDRDQWNLWGGETTRREINMISEEERRDLLQYLRGLPLIYRVMWGERHCILTHSGYHADYPIYNADGTIDIEKSIQTAAAKDEFGYLVSTDLHHIPAKLKFDHYLIVGHYPIGFYNHRKGKIYKNRRYLDLDCGNGQRKDGGRLGCFRMEDGMEFYV